MKNLIKKAPQVLRYKANSFKCDDGYVLEINGEKHDVELRGCGPLGGPESDCAPTYEVSNLNFHRTLIPDIGGYININPIYPGQIIDNSKYIPGVRIDISVPAERFANGEVKIYHQDKLIRPDDVLTSNDNYIVDTSKINLGSIWNLTIDGDPRFQNTLVMILHVYGSTIEFAYQTRVIYSSEYAHIEAAEGRIDFTQRIGADGKHMDINDYIDKIHLTLVRDNTNAGSDMDRTNENLIYPRSYSGGYRETYPPIEFRERVVHNNEVFDDDDYE